MSDEIINATSESATVDSREHMAAEKPKLDYEIGYGKPPATTRFKKGRSGNPRGRKKTEQITDARILLDDILAEPVKIREGGQVRTMTRLEATLQIHRMEALKGHPKSALAFFKLAQKAGVISKINPEKFIKIMQLGGDDGKIVRMYHAEQEALSQSADDDINKPAGRNQKPSNKQRQ